MLTPFWASLAPASPAMHWDTAMCMTETVCLRNYDRYIVHLQVECSASRETHDVLTHELHECVEEQAGAEVLLLAVDCLQQAVQKVIEEQV